MIGNRELNFSDITGMLRRRMWWIIVPTLILPIAAYLISGTLPFRYTSQTLVLVEQQKVPEAWVKSMVAEQLNMRLATMQEQILSRTRLQPLIERFGLYKDEVGKTPMEDLVDRLRHAITVSAVRADFGAYAGGLPGFTIAFTTDNPRLAQQVCAEITSMFIEENLKSHEGQEQGTLDFLKNQKDDAKQKLDDMDGKLAQFKQKYMGQLPGQEQGNMTMVQTLTNQLDAATQQLGRAQQDRTYLASVLAQNEVIWKQSQGAPVASVSRPEELEQQINALKSQLAALESRYTEDYPDVVKTKHQLETLQAKLDAAKSAPPPKAVASSTPVSEPKEIVQARLQIKMLDDAIKAKTAEQQRIQGELRRFESNIQLAPAVEEQYKSLTRDHDTALQFYNDLLKKVAEAEMTVDLTRRQQGEQFRVMDPPNLPERPTFPNRPLFAIGGGAGGFALGLLIMFALEFKDRAIRTERDVEAYLQLPTLALMPWVGDQEPAPAQANGASRWKFWKKKQAQADAAAMKQAVGA